VPAHLQKKVDINYYERDALVAEETPSKNRIGMIETKQVKRAYDPEKDLVCDENTTTNSPKRYFNKPKMQATTNVPKYRKEIKKVYKTPNYDEYHKKME
jgi:hypothetical protein